MRILLDECLPRLLKSELPEHEVRTVREMKWNGIKNGKLLALAAQEFDVFLTVDRNMQYQQNLLTVEIAIVALAPFSNRLEDILPLMPRTREVLSTIQAKMIVEIQL
ncbi:MAG: hypothetical protein EAZ92_05105 [Candidatus Kapaibacterium sp.]|nr:MAG: hypothetical protein EAZ92_05105 [Candidatus Kapabacteria bacterium]